jgi:4-hydroxy-3-methylbut-2-en-1-yl diphosphate synthase IspG/GcpE
MGCVVNGPVECEGADIAIFAGDRRGIIYCRARRSFSDRNIKRGPHTKGRGRCNHDLDFKSL